jgi:hypothetical protein
MQQDADFITADFLYMFQAAMSVFYTPDDGHMTPETCRGSLR